VPIPNVPRPLRSLSMSRHPRLALVGMALLIPLSACQQLSAPSGDRSIIGRSPAALEAGQTQVSAGSPDTQTSDLGPLTTVKRGNLQDTIDLTGQVVPARTAQLSFRSPGTIRTVYVRSGQTVRKGEPLAELALDDAALRAAQTQATVAELAYQSQKARLEELKRGGGTAATAEARANVTRARAAVVEAQVARDAARAGNGPAGVEAQMAQLAVDQAKDEMDRAQQVARRSEAAETTQSALAVRASHRKVEEASIRLDLLRARGGNADAARAIEEQRAQLQLEQARDELEAAKTAAQQSETEGKDSPAAAAAAVRVAERQVQVATLRLQQASMPASAATAAGRAGTGNIEAERQLVRMQMSEAQSQLSAAQANLRSVRAQRTDAQAAQGTGPVMRIDGSSADQRVSGAAQATPVALAPASLATPAAETAAVSAAIAAVRAAEREIAEQSLRIEQLNRAAAAEPVQTPTTGNSGNSVEQQLAQIQLDAAKEDLARAQAAAEAAERRAQAQPQGAPSAASLSVRMAERRMRDAELMRQQLAANAQPPTDAELRLAELSLAQAQDELAQVQNTAQLAAQREGGAAEAAAADTAYAVRSAERKLAEATLRLQQARATDQLARANRDSQGDIPDLRVSAAEATLSAAEARLRELENGSASAQAIQNEEQRTALLGDQALEARTAAQSVVVLAAPFDGTVTSVDAASNQSVEARTTVVRLDDPGRLSVLASVSEWDVTRLAADQRVDVTLPGVIDTTVPGTIADVSAAAVRQGERASFPVRVDLTQVPAGARVGMTASVSFKTRLAEDVLYVPASAVRKQGDQTTVIRVNGDGISEAVRVGSPEVFGNNVAISVGLREQDVVVVNASKVPTPNVAQGASVTTASCSPGC
jgi:multidrug efflux pump subunit AcrA (membrane-fusion protein)